MSGNKKVRPAELTVVIKVSDDSILEPFAGKYTNKDHLEVDPKGKWFRMGDTPLGQVSVTKCWGGWRIKALENSVMSEYNSDKIAKGGDMKQAISEMSKIFAFEYADRNDISKHIKMKLDLPSKCKIESADLAFGGYVANVVDNTPG